MSFLSDLFNRKRQTQNLDNPEKDGTFSDAEEIDPLEVESLKSTEDCDLNISSDKDAEEIYEVVEREILPAKIICPDCGGITLEGLEFCDKCGGELL